MIPPPPSSLHVEGAAHETRIVLEHGRPHPATRLWKRAASALWFGSLVLAWFLPPVFCPLVVATSLFLVALMAVDASRREVDLLALRRDHLRVVRRGLTGRTTDVVPWSSVEAVLLESSEKGARARDALIVRWRDDGNLRWVRVGTGRDPDELTWMRAAFEMIVQRTREAGASP